MKKWVLVFLFFNTIVSASTAYELKLYEQILPLIFQNEPIEIYVDSKSKEMLEGSKIFFIVDECIDADLLIGKDFHELSSFCNTKPIFTTSYQSFKNTKNSFGAFYWRKGRPQIKFNFSRIEGMNLNFPKPLHRYGE